MGKDCVALSIIGEWAGSKKVGRRTLTEKEAREQAGRLTWGADDEKNPTNPLPKSSLRVPSSTSVQH